MVSYVEHLRKGPPVSRGCGCGGARAPAPLPADWEKKLEDLSKMVTPQTRSLPPLQAAKPLPPSNVPQKSSWEKRLDELAKSNVSQYPLPLMTQVKVPVIQQELAKPDRVKERYEPLEVKAVEVKPINQDFKPIDLRSNSISNNRGISRENSFNKMNLPRKGCCGHVFDK